MAVVYDNISSVWEITMTLLMKLIDWRYHHVFNLIFYQLLLNHGVLYKAVVLSCWVPRLFTGLATLSKTVFEVSVYIVFSGN